MYKKTAAAYIRVSTDDQLELSPESQLAEIRRFAEREGYLLLEDHIYSDEGISGKKADKRPGFQRMIATAKEHPDYFSVILVWKYSRFARNQEESIFYKSILRRKCNVDVVSVTEPLLDGPFGSLIERIIEWMDEFYSLRLSQEVKRSMTLNAQKGVRQTIASFGYRLSPDGMVPDPVEAPIVRSIFEDFVNGTGIYPIARKLNAAGIKTHRGNPFENRTIEYIIRNPVYIGKLRWNPSGRTRRDFNHPDIILANGEHEPLISVELWEAAQTKMDDIKARWQYKARPSYNVKFWLQGMLRCDKCGATMVWAQPRYVKCNNYVRGKCTFSQATVWDELAAAILSAMDSDALTFQFDDLTPDDSPAPAPSDDSLTLAAQAIEQAEKRTLRMKEAYYADALSLDEFKRDKAENDRTIAELRAFINSSKSKDAKENLTQKMRSKIAAAVACIKDPAKTLDQKHAAAAQVIRSVSYDRDSSAIHIFYHQTV